MLLSCVRVLCKMYIPTTGSVLRGSVVDTTPVKLRRETAVYAVIVALMEGESWLLTQSAVHVVMGQHSVWVNAFTSITHKQICVIPVRQMSFVLYKYTHMNICNSTCKTYQLILVHPSPIVAQQLDVYLNKDPLW